MVLLAICFILFAAMVIGMLAAPSAEPKALAMPAPSPLPMGAGAD